MSPHLASIQVPLSPPSVGSLRRIDRSWDYPKADTKYLTHGIHTYPAMMIPQVARRLIMENGAEAKVGLDPFCGSGSVLLEFKLAGIECYGVDINPLAALISRAKNTPIEPEFLKNAWTKLRQKMEKSLAAASVSSPSFQNIDFWFKPSAQKRLSIIKSAIDGIAEEDAKIFFLVCFAETVRRSSNTRSAEFKLYRIPQEKLAVYNPDPFEIMSKVVERNIAGMVQLFFSTTSDQRESLVTIILKDLTSGTEIPKKSIDLVVTSPPYGDSSTTVAYGQFSRLSLQWLGFPERQVMQMDKSMLGGSPTPSLEFDFNSPALEEVVRKISKIDELRAREVLSFFVDFQKGASEINRIMKSESKICLVVGNRTVKGIQIPTDVILCEVFKSFGYSHEKTIVRSIPSKRMPKRNSPSNVKGVTLSTMNEEYIPILSRA